MAINPIGVGTMNINSIGNLTQIGSGIGQVSDTEQNSGTSFVNYLKDAIGNVNDLQENAKVLGEKLATGEINDIHSVMIAGQEADLSLQFTLAIRNKIMDAYSEIMRMQV